jgi:hypothetical protein
MHLAVGSGLALLEGAVQLALRWFLEPALPITRAYLTLLRTNFQSDLLISFLIVLGWSAYDLRRRSRERELIAARLEDELHQPTLAALRFQVEPPVLRQVLSRAADLIPTDPERADALLSRIAESAERGPHRPNPVDPLEEELRLFHTFLAVDGARRRAVPARSSPLRLTRLPVPPFSSTPGPRGERIRTTAGDPGRGERLGRAANGHRDGRRGK